MQLGTDFIAQNREKIEKEADFQLSKISEFFKVANDAYFEESIELTVEKGLILSIFQRLQHKLADKHWNCTLVGEIDYHSTSLIIRVLPFTSLNEAKRKMEELNYRNGKL